MLDEIIEKMKAVTIFPSGPDHDAQFVNYTLKERKPGIVMEFGVGAGRHIRNIARQVEHVFGFDSFHGLPESWDGQNRKGDYSQGGILPKVPENVTLVVGLFQESLPSFAERLQQPVAWVHCDADLYSSTKCIFEHLSSHFADGVILNFNEFWNYPAAHLHEAKAFAELIAEGEFDYECIGRTDTSYCQAAFRLWRKQPKRMNPFLERK